LQDLDAIGLGGDPDLDLAVEPPGPAQGGVNRVHAVCGPYHHHLAAFLEAVHHRKELGDHTPLHLTGHLLPSPGDGVKFVDEDDRRGVLLCLVEYLAELLLALAIVLGNNLGACDRDEVRPALACDRLCNQGLSSAGGPEEEDSLRRLDSEFLEE